LVSGTRVSGSPLGPGCTLVLVVLEIANSVSLTAR
jgi:hypothetical protein